MKILFKFRKEKDFKTTVKEFGMNDEIELYSKIGDFLTSDINISKNKAILINRILDYDEIRCNDFLDIMDTISKHY